MESSSRRWPRQIYNILGNESAERFSYYGMKALLATYITKILLETEDQATHIIHMFAMVNYFMPLFGAWIADHVWGRYKTILWISLSYCLGHGVLACADLFTHTDLDSRRWCLYIGLGLIAFGSGGIKPCVSSFMGDQFGPGLTQSRSAAYAAFYWCINLGSTFAYLFIPMLRDAFGYGWAFGVPGIAMAIATFVFWMGRKDYVHVPPARGKGWETSGLIWLVVLGLFTYCLFTGQWNLFGFSALAGILAWAVYIFHRTKGAEGSTNPGAYSSLLALALGHGEGLTPEARKCGLGLGRVLSIFLLVPVFWALFDQSGSTWVMQGNAMESFTFLGYELNADTMQSANPIMVMVLIPLLSFVVYPMFGKRATPLRKMSAGMFLAAASFVIVAGLQQRVDDGEKLSILWQFLPYIVLTLAEVLVSTTGLEFAFSQAEKSMRSMVTGLWNATVAVGNYVVILITMLLKDDSGKSAVSADRFMLYAGMTAVVAVVFCIVAAFYKYRTDDEVETA